MQAKWKDVGPRACVGLTLAFSISDVPLAAASAVSSVGKRVIHWLTLLPISERWRAGVALGRHSSAIISPWLVSAICLKSVWRDSCGSIDVESVLYIPLRAPLFLCTLVEMCQTNRLPRQFVALRSYSTNRVLIFDKKQFRLVLWEYE